MRWWNHKIPLNSAICSSVNWSAYKMETKKSFFNLLNLSLSFANPFSSSRPSQSLFHWFNKNFFFRECESVNVCSTRMIGWEKYGMEIAQWLKRNAEKCSSLLLFVLVFRPFKQTHKKQKTAQKRCVFFVASSKLSLKEMCAWHKLFYV